MKLLLVGIDPDIKGAVAAMQVESDEKTTYGKYSSLQINEKTLHYIDAFINDQSNAFGAEKVLITLERVHSRPSDGVKQAFSFGSVVGAIRARLRDFKYKEMRPVEWQKYFPLMVPIETLRRTSSVKEKSRVVASLLLKKRGRNEIPQGEADAFCIMLAGYLHETKKGKMQ